MTFNEIRMHEANLVKCGCDGDPSIHERNREGPWPVYVAYCSGCAITQHIGYKDIEKAVEKWNRSMSGVKTGTMTFKEMTVKQAVKDIIAFRRAVGLEIGTTPKIPSKAWCSSDWRVVVEEFMEFHDGVYAEDIEEIADGGIDLIVTVLGFLLRCGIDPVELWNRVHAANMAKAGGPKRADGKAMKPEGWQPPDIAGALEVQPSLDTIYPELGVTA